MIIPGARFDVTMRFPGLLYERNRFTNFADTKTKGNNIQLPVHIKCKIHRVFFSCAILIDSGRQC